MHCEIEWDILFLYICIAILCKTYIVMRICIARLGKTCDLLYIGCSLSGLANAFLRSSGDACFELGVCVCVCVFLPGCARHTVFWTAARENARCFILFHCGVWVAHTMFCTFALRGCVKQEMFCTFRAPCRSVRPCECHSKVFGGCMF